MRQLWGRALGNDEGVLSARAEAVLAGLQDAEPSLSAPLTAFQARVLEADAEGSVFRSDQHLLLSAPTSSGKTTVAEVLLVGQILRRPEGSAVYVAPTRALAYAMHEQLQERHGGALPASRIVVSTAERSEDDWRIERFDFDIASMVYEKARLLFARPPVTARSLALLVVDEWHMLEDPQRGPSLEVTLAKALARHGQQGSGRGPRIVALSTEPVASDALRALLSVRRRGGLGSVAPLEIHGEERPVEVRHHFVLYGGIGSSEIQYPIATFEAGSDGRTLPGEALAQLTGALEGDRRLSALDKAHRMDEHAERVESFLAGLVAERPTGSQILVVVHSPTEAHRLGQYLATACVRADPRVQLPGPVAEVLSDHADPRVKEQLTDLARREVYLHHSEIDPEVRAAVELIFREPLHPGSPTRVLLATDTLAYGVNLAIDVVVLCDIHFYTGQRRGGVEREQLAQHRYHNILGRAGRLGRCAGGSADAYIVVRAISGRGVADIVRKYYGAASAVRSALFIEKYDGAGSAEPASAFEKMSAPWVRAALDALRYANNARLGASGPQPATVDDVLDVLRFTLYIAEDRSDATTLVASIAALLQAAASPAFGLVEAVEGERPSYRILPLGEALADTGTAHTTTRSLLELVRIVGERWREGEDADAPASLFLLAVLAQPEVTSSYGRQTLEADAHAEERLGHRLRDALERTFERALAGLGARRPGPLANGLLVDLQSFVLSYPPASKPPPSDRLARGIVRTWAALIRWIEGAPWDREVQAILRGLPDGAGLPPPRIVSRWSALTRLVSWKTLFLGRLFDAAWSVPAAAGSFEDLAERSVHGCTQGMGALFGRPGLRFVRADGLALAQAGWTPERLLRDAPESLPGIIGVNRMVQVQRMLADGACTSLRRVAALGLSALPETAAGRSVRRAWLALRDELYPAALAAWGGEGGDVEAIARQAADVLGAAAAEVLRSQADLAPPAVRAEIAGRAGLLAAAGASADAAEIVAVLPWSAPREPTTAVVLQADAVGVLLTALATGALPARRWPALAAHTVGRAYTVEDLVAMLSAPGEERPAWLTHLTHLCSIGVRP